MLCLEGVVPTKYHVVLVKWCLLASHVARVSFSRIYFVPVGVCGFVVVSDDVGVSSGCQLLPFK